MFSRRRLLGASAAALFAAGALIPLSACDTVKKITAAAAQDAIDLANGLASGLKSIGQFVPAPIATAAQNAINTIVTAATALKTAAQTSSAALVQQIEASFNSLVTLLQGFNLPAPISTVLQAAAALLPVIESAVGIVVTAVTGTGGSTPAAKLAAAAPMSADQARAILHAAAVAH